MSTDDLTPLEILLAGMKVAYEARNWENAHRFASAAAPYCHAKLQAIEHGGVEDNKIVVNIVRFSDIEKENGKAEHSDDERLIAQP
jgi:hypothetical protein